MNFNFYILFVDTLEDTKQAMATREKDKGNEVI